MCNIAAAGALTNHPTKLKLGEGSTVVTETKEFGLGQDSYARDHGLAMVDVRVVDLNL